MGLSLNLGLHWSMSTQSTWMETRYDLTVHPSIHLSKVEWQHPSETSLSCPLLCQLTGSIPESWGVGGMPDLFWLYLNSTELCGNRPNWIFGVDLNAYVYSTNRADPMDNSEV